MSTDEELVSEALRGSASSFNRLVERYQERLFRFLLARCSSRADAEDAMQDTFVNALRYLQSYNPRWQFSTWLYRIAIRSAGRNAHRNTAGGGGHSAQDHAELADDAPDPLEQCIQASERENLWLAAKQLLSQEAYAAMWLRYAEDMPVKDVARALGRPQSWTRVVLLRARRRLAERLNDDSTAGDESKAYG
ncbi:MAG: sigma-70 family RNA polymerase sigma factor [Woeseia sp.]